MAYTRKGQKTSTVNKQPPKRKAASTEKQSPSKRAKRAPAKAENLVTSPLLAIPAELRNEIYELVLVDENEGKPIPIGPWPRKPGWPRFLSVSQHEAQAWAQMTLLHICESIRNEAFAMYFGSHSFELTLHLTEFEYLATWLRTLVARCGKTPIKQLILNIWQPQSCDLRFIRPFVDLFYETEMELECRLVGSNEQPSSIRRQGPMPTRSSGRFFFYNGIEGLERAIKEAMDLGKKARQQEWHEGWLDVEFGGWLEEKLNGW